MFHSLYGWLLFNKVNCCDNEELKNGPRNMCDYRKEELIDDGYWQHKKTRQDDSQADESGDGDDRGGDG